MSLHPRQSCPSGKIAYSNAGDAKRAAMRFALKDMRMRGAGKVNVPYKCPYCGAWHRTSKR